MGSFLQVSFFHKNHMLHTCKMDLAIVIELPANGNNFCFSWFQLVYCQEILQEVRGLDTLTLGFCKKNSKS